MLSLHPVTKCHDVSHCHLRRTYRQFTWKLLVFLTDWPVGRPRQHHANVEEQAKRKFEIVWIYLTKMDESTTIVCVQTIMGMLRGNHWTVWMEEVLWLCGFISLFFLLYFSLFPSSGCSHGQPCLGIYWGRSRILPYTLVHMECIHLVTSTADWSHSCLDTCWL